MACAANAAPYIPPSDSLVLEHVASRGDDGLADGRRLKAALAREPRNVAMATRLATLLIAQSRRESDPRPLGRAQAVLAPWWNEPDAPVAVLVLRATIRQSVHDFSAARLDLERALARDPRNAQAWLTLATVQQVTGDLPAARASCARLARLAASLVQVTCAAAVDGANGQAAGALLALTAAIEQSRGAPAGVLAWAATLQAELAQRAGRAELAEASFREALALDAGDAYAIAAYADFLLDQGRPRDVVRLIPAQTPVDTLLLRYAIAARSLGVPEAENAARTLDARFAAARARGDRTHLREQARFALQVSGDAPGALELALQNWQVQKEPADARIALEAAAATRQSSRVRAIADWARSTRVEDAAIARLVAS